jgi:23S rRNA (adenine2503-C2)-methyltransferase
VTQKEFIKNFSLSELEQKILSLGYPKYRAAQIYSHVYNDRIEDFSQMSTIPKEMREELSSIFNINSITIAKSQKSKDSSTKFLFKLYDNQSIETVLIPEYWDKIRNTVCISTQVGCLLGCKFCATGSLGFTRNLEVTELLDQIFQIEKSGKLKITNVVLMGMGEPLLNYDNVIKAINILNEGKEKIISNKKITLSTIGLVPEILRLAKEKYPPKLAISLHATNDTTRELLIPAAKKWPLRHLGDAVELYYRKTNIPITYEYILFDGLNDTADDAERLVKITNRVASKVNIIPFNDISFILKNNDIKLSPSSTIKVKKFTEILRYSGVNVFIRKSAGADIQAACGQLALSERDSNVI